MGDRLRDQQQTYSEEQVGTVLKDLGIEVESDTRDVFLINCPFHGGTDTPSFVVSKDSGVYFCFNPSCAESGNLLSLVRSFTSLSIFEAQRFILKRKMLDVDMAELFKKKLIKNDDYEIFSQEVLDKTYSEFKSNPRPQEYMKNRGFKEETLDHFKVGYSAKQDMIVTPMHDPKGNPVGLIGRTVEGKRFKNSTKLPRNRTLWNYHRAKNEPFVVVTESNFDAMRVWQAGYNSVALLGGYVSAEHIDQLGKTFPKVVIMTDDDKLQYVTNCKKCTNYCQGHNPGLDIGKRLVAELPMNNVRWADSGQGTRYFNGAKDAGDMTDDEIKQCIEGALTNYQFMVQYK